ncbi:hypothetical protein ACHAXR_009028 [Thalassiosira sp. AJA248-18]
MIARGHSRYPRLRRSRICNSRHLQSAVIEDDGARWGDGSSTSLSAIATPTPIDVNLNCRRTHSTASSFPKLGQRHHPVPPWHSCQNIHHPSHITHIPTRYTSSTSSSITEQLTSILPPTPEFVTNATFWGATGILLTNFHTHLHLPYWACISLTNICIRSAMIPIAIQGAKTSVKFGTISPEVQYLITSFTNDMKALKARGMWSQEGSFMAQQSSRGQMVLIKSTMQTLRGLFKLNKVNLLDIFKSPTLQIPFFWYFALDLRKVIEGSDPLLAQQLVESSFFWLTDLTEADPWYGLPIATGALLYLNVETAMGKKTLGGETSSKSNMAVLLKDAFQTLAIFMPCFMAQQPSGVQLYLATSMVFTLLQSHAMRTDTVRQAVGLPPMNTKPKGMTEGEHVKDFLEKMEMRQAAKAKGGFILGEGVNLMGAQVSIPRSGKKRKSTIVVEKKETEVLDESQMIKVEFEVPEYNLRTGLLVVPELYKSTPVPFLHGMKEPEFQTPHGMTTPTNTDGQLSMAEIPLSQMEAANRGEKPVEMAPKEVLAKRVEGKKKSSGPIDVDKLKSKWNRKKGGKRGKK